MANPDTVPLSHVLDAQTGGRLPLSAALYTCSEVARLVASEHELSRGVAGLDVDQIRCTRSGAVVLPAARTGRANTREEIKAVGTVCYRLLTGKAPAANDVVAPSHFNPGVDEDLDAVILASLAPDASQRPASVRVLEGALAAVFEELELPVSSDGLAQVVKSIPPPKAARPAPAPVAAQPVIAPRPALVSRRPPPGWYAVDEDEEDEDTQAQAPSWQTQEREKRWMVGITVALVAVALLWVFWPAPKPSRASFDEPLSPPPPARVVKAPASAPPPVAIKVKQARVSGRR